ncbi:PorT family protein [Tamlana haliotis]|uniref:PorT family protein n=1 Tax=Pseudotamlana haliotis TaxID=2614804 RepID=A0A6N6MB44_9FLAO|nr:porin family protein [Tamlana haliotis]KAB1067780.1 PorT family protein [Tamlana haliotis]
MKKVFLIGFTLFTISSSSHAQAALFALLFGDKVATENFNVSLEAGGTFMGYSNLEDSERSKMGINFGIGGNIKLNENWFICPNIYFLAKRNLFLNHFSLDSGNPALDANFTDIPTKITLDYIDVPIFFSYQTNNKKYRFSLAPQFSFLQKSRGIFERSEGDFTQNFDGYTRDVDYGMMVDFAYVLGKAHKGKGLIIHLRYYHGFTDVLNDQISTADNRSNYLSLHLSLPFITDELAAKNLEQESE